MSRPWATRVALIAAVASTPGVAAAQRYPLLDSTAVALLSGELSGDAAYDHVRVLTSYHRPQGSDTLGVAARYVERMAKQFGLQLIPSERSESTNRDRRGRRAVSIGQLLQQGDAERAERAEERRKQQRPLPFLRPSALSARSASPCFCRVPIEGPLSRESLDSSTSPLRGSARNDSGAGVHIIGWHARR